MLQGMFEQLLTWSEMTDPRRECSYQWEKVPLDRPISVLIVISVVLVTLMTLWRITLTNVSKKWSYGYIFRQTQIDVESFEKPKIFANNKNNKKIDDTQAPQTTETQEKEQSLLTVQQYGVLDEFCKRTIKLDKKHKKIRNRNRNRAKKYIHDSSGASSSSGTSGTHGSSGSSSARSKVRGMNNDSNSSVIRANWGEISKLSTQLNIHTNDIESYMNYYKNSLLIRNLMHKYCEELWKSITMGLITSFGIYALYDKRFVYNSRYLFGTFPQNMPFEIECYYYLSIAYHGHRLIWQYFDTVRKDWLANFIHHWVTICLILFSYKIGFTEIGVYVMIVHDNSDFFLSLAKIMDYIKVPSIIHNMVFIFFVLSWFIGRIGVFMFRIILPCSQMYFVCSRKNFMEYYGFFGGLSCLWILHCYWGVMIINVARRLIFKGKLVDHRSGADEAGKKKIKTQKQS